jgi:hypothetical protein
MYFLINADVASLVPLSVFMAFLSGALSGTVGPNMRCARRWGGLLPGKHCAPIAPPWPTSAASCADCCLFSLSVASDAAVFLPGCLPACLPAGP